MADAPLLFDAKDAWITPSIAIAVFALIFTVGSFWWIQVRRGRLRCYTSHSYSGAFAPHKLVLVLPLALHNPAPAPLIVADLRLRIHGMELQAAEDPADLPMNLRWIASHTSVYPSNTTRAYSSAFVVDGRMAMEKFVEFQRDDPPTLLEHGPYTATIEALIEPRRWWTQRKWRTIASFTFNTQLATGNRASLIPRSNDPDLWCEGDQVWN